MAGKKKIKWVYCPKCGEVSDAALLYCEHCKESLRGAAEVDPGEAKIKKRRERSIKRDTKRRANREKREALFEKVPILEPLYYLFWVCLIIGILVGIVQLFALSELAGFIAITIAFIALYLWYAPLVVDNIDYFDSYTEKLPPIARERERIDIHRIMWGLVIGGAFIILCLCGWMALLSWNCLNDSKWKESVIV